MNGQIKEDLFLPWRNSKHSREDASWCNQCLFLCTHYQARFHQRKWACFTRLVSAASSAFTDSFWEEWKALIVSFYLTQWLLNGLRPINLAVTRSIAAGSVTNSHKRQEPSAEQSLPTNWFSDQSNVIQNLRFPILALPHDPHGWTQQRWDCCGQCVTVSMKSQTRHTFPWSANELQCECAGRLNPNTAEVKCLKVWFAGQ